MFLVCLPPMLGTSENMHLVYLPLMLGTHEDMHLVCPPPMLGKNKRKVVQVGSPPQIFPLSVPFLSFCFFLFRLR